MSPTVFRPGPYRGFFFSREQPRMHVHGSCSDGEAKFWLEPALQRADHSRTLTKRPLHEVEQLVEGNRDEIERAWRQHFGDG